MPVNDMLVVYALGVYENLLKAVPGSDRERALEKKLGSALKRMKDADLDDYGPQAREIHRKSLR